MFVYEIGTVDNSYLIVGFCVFPCSDRSMSSPIEQTAMQSMILHTEDDIPESPPPPHEFNSKNTHTRLGMDS